MSDTKLLNFKTPTISSGHLEITVQNDSGAKLDDKLLIEVMLPVSLVDQRIRDAVELASTNEDTPNFASLSGVVTTAEGWTVWAFNSPNIASVRVYNHLDAETAKVSNVTAGLEAGAALTLRVPLAEKNPRAQITIPYSYQYGGREADTIEGKLELITAGAGACNPKVSLTTDQTSPTMIPAGRKIKIFWAITGGVSAVLRGPMSGGHSELRLETEPGADYCMEKGELTLYAVGTATYMLDAEVCGPEGQPNVQVVRILQLDIKKAEEYSSLVLRPDKVLPNAEVDLNWAVWGVKKAILSIGNRRKITLTLTEQDLKRNFQGAGIWRINAGNRKETVTLKIADAKDDKLTVNRELAVTKWLPWKKIGYTGKPVAMAVVAPKMALVTTDGLWLTNVGKVDDGSGELDQTFRKVATDAPKAWLALTGFENSFAVLQQTAADGLRVARFKSDGTPPGALLGNPVDLPDVFKPILNRTDSFFDLVALDNREDALENRVYVVAQNLAGFRRSFSVRFNPAAQARPEPWLDRLTDYRLLSFNGGLYAVHRGSGRMVRFDLNEKGELDAPRKAASATHKNKTLIRKGMLVPVGSVLAVLDPEPFAGLRSQALVGMTGAIETDLPKHTEPQEEIVPLETTQDLIYNPQTNEWSPCGHGLKIKPGAVVAYRGGVSERLWVLQPDGEMPSLTGASEDLFAQDYLEKFPSAVLPVLINKKRQFKLKTPFALMPMGENYRRVGVNDLSSTDPAELTTPRPRGEYPNEFTVELKYNEADPAPIALRFMVRRELRSSAEFDHMLEVTFSGFDLSSATSVFKRITEKRVDVAIDEVFGSQLVHTTNNVIEVPRPKRFDETFHLVIVNASPYRLKQTGIFQEHPYILDDPVEFEIKQVYAGVSFVFEARVDTPPGTLRITFDFTKPAGFENRTGREFQQTTFRMNPDDGQTMQARLVKLLNPGDPALTLEGSKQPIAATNKPLYVCQIGYLKP